MVDWCGISVVLLDMDGTLLDLHFDNYFWQEYVPIHYAQRYGITLAKAKAELEPRFAQVYGRLEWYCLDYWERELKLDIVAIKREIIHLISFRPYADDFLRDLKNRGKKVVLITNAHPGSLSLKLERLPLAHYFDHLISSHDYGYPKEDQSFWRALEADVTFKKQHALFIDDNTAVLGAARTYGISKLLAIRYPDSQKGPRDTGDYQAVYDFRELIFQP